MRWDSLASLPLFIGMSQKELESIMTQTRIDFNKVDADTVIVRRNQKCGKLVIAISGELLCETCSDDNAYKIEEEISAPMILQPVSIFGKYQVHENDNGRHANQHHHLRERRAAQAARQVADFPHKPYPHSRHATAKTRTAIVQTGVSPERQYSE